MSVKKMFFLPRSLLASTVLIGLASTARAGVAVSPLKQEISLRPGESGKLTITLSDIARDGLAEPQNVHIDVTDVRVAEDGSLALPAASSQPDSASKWITLPEADLTINSGKSLPLEVTVTPPLNAPPGEYYSSVLVTLARKGKTDRGIIVQYRVASGIFLTVQGRLFPKQGKIKNSQFNWPAVSANQPAASPDTPPNDSKPTLAVVLENVGRARFDGSGKVRVFDKDAHLVYGTALTSVRPCVFAGDSRLFEAVMSKPLPAGSYLARIEMDYQSGWSVAHTEIPLDVSPDQAASWARAIVHKIDDNSVVESATDRIAATVFPGSSRNYAINLRNISDYPVHAVAGPTSEQNSLPLSWLVIASDEFAIGKAGRRSVPIGLQIPTDAKPGTYSTRLIIQAGPQGLPMAQQLSIPIDLEVKAERK